MGLLYSNSMGIPHPKVLGSRRMDSLLYAADCLGRPVHYVETCITLDNKNRSLPLNTSIQIHRRFHRKLESEFFLDGLECRLKDIRGLLQYTLHMKEIAFWGLSERESFLELSPTELRQVWNVSAGYHKDLLRIETLMNEFREPAYSTLMQTFTARFQADFMELSRMFLTGIYQWLGYEASLFLTHPDDLVATGIKIEGLPSDMTVHERSLV